MTREEMKKKIYEMVLAELQNQFGCGDAVETGDREVCAEAVADALIAAEIGDVKEAESEANRYERLYKLQSRDMLLAERRAHEAEHRAKVAEKALNLCETAYILALNGKRHEGI